MLQLWRSEVQNLALARMVLAGRIALGAPRKPVFLHFLASSRHHFPDPCLLYTSDAADDC